MVMLLVNAAAHNVVDVGVVGVFVVVGIVDVGADVVVGGVIVVL